MADCIPLVYIRPDMSEEEKAAQLFCQEAKDYFREISGKVYVVPSLRKERDLDLVVWMHFDKFKPSIKTGYISNPGQVNEKVITFRKMRDVWFNSALLVVELKKHSTQDAISIRNGKLYVKYGSEFKNASDQNFDQIFPLQRYLLERLDVSLDEVPRIQNFIWLNRCIEKPIDYDDLDNVIYGKINFNDLLQQLCNLNKPVSFDEGANISFTSCKSSEILVKMDELFNFMRKEKANGLGIITRSKFERIVNQRLNVENIQKVNEIGDKFLIIKGKPGTGKTIYLINIAFHLNKLEYKTVILTFNKALEQDLKRMLFHSGYGSVIVIKTIHSFFLQLLKEFGICDKVEIILENFESYLNIFFEEIKDMPGRDIRELLKIPYDTALIDEAQDCLEIEKSLIFKIFDHQNIVVSVGDRQLVREKEIKWTNTIERRHLNLITLDISHRNKKDLVDFFNFFSIKHYEQHPWELKENHSLTGGKLHIIPTRFYNQALHFQLVNELIKKDNSMYDLMFLTPNKDSINYPEKLTDMLSEWGFKAFNNTLKEDSLAFPIDEHRILNYHSCRGLETWILVCWNLDIIIRNIKYEFNGEGRDTKDLMLFVNNWLLIIFTRAIDTLVITFADENSEEAKLLIELAESQSFAHMSEIRRGE